MRHSLAALISAAALSASMPGQNLMVHDILATMFVEGAGISALYPGGGMPIAAFPQFAGLPPAFPGPGGLVIPPGGVGIDGATGTLWYSNGPLIASQPHPAYAAPGLFTAPYPPPPFPPPPGGILVPAGFVSGMTVVQPGAIAPVATLWLTNGFTVQAVVPGPGGAVVFPPFAPGFLAMGVMTGLDWDPATGTLWAVDVAGIAYNFFPGGAPVAAPLPPPIGFPGPVTGMAIDRSGLPVPGGLAPPLYAVSMGMILEYGTGFPLPSFAGAEVGMTYHAAPSPFPTGGPCACPDFVSGFGLRGPMVNTNPNFGVDWVGLPAGQTVILGADLVFDPTFPGVNGFGCPLGLNLLSPTFGFLVLAADAAGTFSFPISLVGVPVGTTFYTQYMTACPSDPAGVILSALFPVQVSAP